MQLESSIVDESAVTATEGGRLRTRLARRYIASSANHLVSLANGAGNLGGLTWTSLRELPHWCLLDDEQRSHLQLVAGAVYLLPCVQKSVDRVFLLAVREAIGHAPFNYLQHLEVDGLSNDHAEPDSDFKEALRSAGAAVLLSTLQEKSLIALYFPILGRPVSALSQPVAMRLYLLATDVIQQCENTRKDQMSSSVAAPESGDDELNTPAVDNAASEESMRP